MKYSGTGKIIGFIVLLFLLIGCKSKQEPKTLLVYCAAVVKPALEEIAEVYYHKTGVQLDLQYGGSGTLLANIRISKQGDLYLSADASYMKQAITYNLVEQSKPIVAIAPVLAVRSNNPKKIKAVSDVCKTGIRFGVANPEAASVGAVTKKLLQESVNWEAVKKCIYVQMPTVSDVANAIKLNTIDAGVIWNVTANQYKEIDIVKVDDFNTYKDYTSIAVLKWSKQPNEALKFTNFLLSDSNSINVFKKLGYKMY